MSVLQTDTSCVLLYPADPILLDGLLQAVTLKSGDVVAVRTAARPMPTYFGCFEHQMQLNPQSIHRPVLASVVQVGFVCLCCFSGVLCVCILGFCVHSGEGGGSLAMLAARVAGISKHTQDNAGSVGAGGVAGV